MRKHCCLGFVNHTGLDGVALEVEFGAEAAIGEGGRQHFRLDRIRREIRSAFPFYEIPAVFYFHELGNVFQFLKRFIFKIGTDVKLSHSP